MKKIIAAVVAVLTLAAAGPSAASDGESHAWAEASLTGSFGGLDESGTTVSDAVTPQEEYAAGESTAAAAFAIPGPTPPFSCPLPCWIYAARGAGEADLAAGVVRADALASMGLYGSSVSGRVLASGGAGVQDAITLSEPAIVRVRGRLTGGFSGNGLGELYARVGFVLEDGTQGLNRYLTTLGGETVDIAFDVPVDLPAGTTWFEASLLARAWAGLNSEGNVDAEADFDDTLTFEVVLPAGVTATSSSGVFPFAADASDQTPPTVAAPADVTASNDGARCDALIAVGEPVAADDRPGVFVVGARSDGAALDAPYPVGTTTITWAATDAAGNIATATQTVTVVDGENPTVGAPAGVERDNNPGRGEASVDPGTALAVDNCAGVGVAGSRSDGAALSAPYPVGTTTVTWTATDAAGNTASATQTILVLDVEAPSISTPSGVMEDATSPSGATVSYAASAGDNVAVTSFSCAPATGSTFAIGDTTVNCTAADAAGNPASASFVVHVRGAGEQLADLAASLTDPSLTAQVQAAAASVAADNAIAACNMLSALLHHVDAQEGKQLTQAEANAIRAAVARIRGVLGC